MTETDTPIPSYKRPPIIESVWSVQFAEMDWLLPPHTGLFWSLIREQFPGCEEQAPIAHVIESEDVFSQPARRTEIRRVPPLTRQWFVSDSETELIQLQRDRFCCNWRRTQPSDVYPRYGHMKELFESAWTTLTEFIVGMGQPPLSVDQCEMTYINHMEQGQGWSTISEVGQVFPLMTWQDDLPFLQNPRTIAAKLAFDLPSLNGRLHASLKHGIRTDEPAERKEVLILEITARGLPGDTEPSGLLQWYALAREAIVRGFTDLTSPEMHRLWEREQ